MSLLRYNNVQLNISTIKHEDHDVYSEDGADLLYNHHTVYCQCWFNPEATSDGNPLALSLYHLRQKLMTPRQALQLSYGGNVTLQSPATL